MHWRVTLEAIDPTGDGYQKEFMFEKCLDQLSEGHVGCSVEHGKMIMAEIQKIVTEREVALQVECSRICRSCAGLLPIKDYQTRSILTVYGAVQVKYPRLMFCQKCNPSNCSTFSPLASICQDRATPELLELSAKLGATMPYRQASDILGTFLPGHLPKRFTTLRSRALRVGKRIDDAERRRYWHEAPNSDTQGQLELPLDRDINREIVFSIDTAHIPKIKQEGGRTFEAVVGHCGRGGRGGSPGPLFSFEGTRSGEIKAIAQLALLDQDYRGSDAITVISDGESCLKRLAKDLPQPVTHILDWFHISMKIQPLVQLARTAPEEMVSFLDDISRVKWRLWNGQPDRASALINCIQTAETLRKAHNIWAMRTDKLLKKLANYISTNRSSVVDYGTRYRAGQRIATSTAEASVNALVAKRFVKKQQMRWSRMGAHYLLKVRAAVINGDLTEKQKYRPTHRDRNQQQPAVFTPLLPFLTAA